MIGFKVNLSWHYLVLFSPIFIGATDNPSFAFFLERQFTLYLTLALSFGALVGVGRFFLKRNKTAPSTLLLGAAGLLATVASVLSLATLSADTGPSTISQMRLIWLWKSASLPPVRA